MPYRSQVFVDKVLPAFRALVSQEMSHEYGMTQEEIASSLEVSQAMVSNYLSEGSRLVKKLSEDPQIQVLVEEAAAKAANREGFTEELRGLISQIQDRSLVKEFSNAEGVL